MGIGGFGSEYNEELKVPSNATKMNSEKTPAIMSLA